MSEADVLKRAIEFVKDKYIPLPMCFHGYNLCDWGGTELNPPCGCTLWNVMGRWHGAIKAGFTMKNKKKVRQ